MSRKPLHNHAHPEGATTLAPPRAIAAGLARARAQCGTRLTETREAVLRLVLESARPVTAYEILDALSKRTGRSRNPPTVYRALDFLLDQGIVTRVESLNAFTACAHLGEDHACVFFLCTCCGEAKELVDPRIEAQLLEMAGKLDFTINQPVVEVSGLCRNCHHEHGHTAAEPEA